MHHDSRMLRFILENKPKMLRKFFFFFAVYPEQPQGGVLTAQGSICQYIAEQNEKDFFLSIHVSLISHPLVYPHSAVV